MQAESFELQKQYDQEYIAKHPNWELVDIYADEGISATSVKNRREFIRLMNDCKDGKIDLMLNIGDRGGAKWRKMKISHMYLLKAN